MDVKKKWSLTDVLFTAEKKSRGTVEGQEDSSFARTIYPHSKRFCWHRTLHSSEKSYNSNVQNI